MIDPAVALIDLDPYASSLDHLMAALQSIDLRVRWAVVRARANGLNPDNQFRGLFVTDEQADELLGYELGHNLWGRVNGHATDELRQALGNWETKVAEARTKWQGKSEAGVAMGERYALQLLVEDFGLSQTAVDILLIALAPEIDLRYEKLFSYLQDDVTRKRPTVNLILNLLTNDYAEKLRLRALFDPASPLIKWGLIECYGDQSQKPSLLTQYVRPNPRVVEYLLGRTGIDQGIAEDAELLCLPFEDDRDGYFSAELTHFLQTSCERTPLFAFRGVYGVGKWAAAQLVAETSGRNLMRIDLATLSENALGLKDALQLVLRDSLLNNAILYLNGWDSLLKDDKPPAKILRQLLAHPQIVITSGEAHWQPVDRQTKRAILAVELGVPAHANRVAIWEQLTTAETLHEDVNIPLVATHFRFTPGQIADAVSTARDMATARNGAIGQADLLAASRFHSNQRLSSVAVKIAPRYHWDDIILPQDTRAQLYEAVSMVKQKPTVYDDWGFDRKLAMGKGMNALFAGDPGTGKTMSAEIVANDLGLDMYKIDLSMMVSKYIGETEKNISKVFDEAATSNAILFFDEADAIFGKRSEVKDSHDRHANIEVSYLLQRMESFNGVVILATNLRSNIDEAFTRRLHFAIQFPFPEVQDREHIWRVTFPKETPLADDVDFHLLAKRFRMAGGSIRNIVLASAFLAAEAGSPAVKMTHILHAARREHQKIGRLINESLFEWRES
ncbi:MAG: ATP-binding protein [Candidatus Promineifilaceae bacterium]